MGKRKRDRDGGEPQRGFPCPKKGCTYLGVTDRALAIHFGTKHRDDSVSISDEDLSNDSQATQSSAPSSSVGAETQSECSKAETGSGLPAVGDSEQGASGQQCSDQAAEGPSLSGSPAGSSSLDAEGGLQVDLSAASSGTVSSEDSVASGSGAKHASSAGRNAEALTPHEEALRELLTPRPQREQDRWLKLITDPAFDPAAVRWRSSRALKKYMENVDQQVGLLLQASCSRNTGFG